MMTILNRWRIAAAFLFLVICSVAHAQPRAAVDAVLDAWHAAATKADETAYFSHFSADAVFMGTDATERWTVEQFRAFAKPYFGAGKAWTFTPRDRHVNFASDQRTAWFDEMLDTLNLGECRGSGVMVLSGSDWRIAQYNLSIPIPNALCDAFVDRIAAHKASGPEIRVYTFNIRYDNQGDGDDRWERRRSHVAMFLREQNADVIGLQEALHSQLTYLQESMPEMGSLGVGRDDGKTRGEHVAVLYRKDRWKPAEEGTFWFSDTPDEVASKGWGNRIVRICTWARFVPVNDETSTGFYFYNLHLDHESQPSRERSVVLLLEKIAARTHGSAPVIVTGDFNTAENNRAVLAMKGEIPLSELAPNSTATELSRMRFADSFRVLHPDEHIVGTFGRFRGVIDGDKIDYVFVGPGIRVNKATIHRERRDGTGGRDLSDHYPVSAVLTLPTSK